MKNARMQGFFEINSFAHALCFLYHLLIPSSRTRRKVAVVFLGVSFHVQGSWPHFLTARGGLLSFPRLHSVRVDSFYFATGRALLLL
jgi:hypothetical protein